MCSASRQVTAIKSSTSPSGVLRGHFGSLKPFWFKLKYLVGNFAVAKDAVFSIHPSVGLAPGCVSDTADSVDRADSPHFASQGEEKSCESKVVLDAGPSKGTC